MPALRLFGRRWHISSDDLALPTGVVLLFHVVALVMFAYGLHIVQSPPKCLEGTAYERFLTWALSCAAVSLVLEVLVIYKSSQGAL